MEQTKSGPARFTLALAIAVIVGLVGTAADAGASQRVSRVHSGGTFTYRDGHTAAYLWDEGRLTAVDPMSVSIERADGVALTFGASDATTCIRVDGLEAHLVNLLVGQAVAVVSDATGAQALAIHVG